MLLRNSLWNLSGVALPSIVALATVPVMIHGLGLEGFGIVTLIGSVIGYFGLLDVNLSAGAIKYLSQYHTQKDGARFAQTFWFGAAFYGTLGLVGGAAIWLCAPMALEQLFKVSDAARADTLLALQVAALGFLMSQMQSYLLIVPQALQRYDRSAQGEILFGIIGNLAAAGAAAGGAGIAGVIGARVAVNALNIAWLVRVLRALQVPLAPAWPARDVVRSMSHFSAYAYLSRLATLFHQHGDKLIIGTIAGPVALAFYTVPTQLAGRVLGLSYRLSSVIFPRVSALAAGGEQAQLRTMYLDASRLLTYLNLSVLGMIVLVGDEFLRRWVGAEFVTPGYPVLVLITLALMVDSLTNIPSLITDGLGQPRVTGRFALARGLVGLVLVYAGTRAAGIEGAAVAHLASSALMTSLFLAYVHGRTVPVSFGDAWRLALFPSLGVGCGGVLLMLAIKPVMPETTAGAALLALLSLLTLGAAGMALIATAGEREFLRDTARRWVART